MRRIRSLALVVAVSAALFPAVSARAGDPTTFYGSGWGHGLGLSQWGAYGLASDGWSSTQIVTHFYSGTRVTKVADPPGDIRIALAAGEDVIHLTAEAGPVRLSVEEPVGGTLVGQLPAGETWIERSVHGAYEVHDAAGAVVGGKTWGSESSDLFATYADHGARVTVPEGGATYNRGTLEFNLTMCANGCSLRLILQVPFEEYLLGIGEVPSSWPVEALRAQAIAARSFALYKVRKYGIQPSCNCDLTDGSNDQVYIGWDKEGGLDGRRWVKAVRSTAGSIVTYEGADALTV
ncbi:MAG: SpoIID/LytB domain-containing protein, partial [Actinomycetota bacterium]